MVTVNVTNFTGRAKEEDKIVFDNPTDYLTRQFDEHEHNLQTGFYKNMGGCYDFRPFLKRFVFNLHGSWFCSYAPNKTLLKKAVCGVINEIHQLPNPHVVKK
jgi:hypothetical protein